MLRIASSWLAVASFSLAAVVVAGESAQPVPSGEQIAAWIRNLDHEDYATREAACASLAAAGRPAVAPVAKAILSDSPEAAWRANDILEQIGISGDEQTLELVSQALDEVAKSSKNSANKATSDVQKRWKRLRHERAVTQIVKLGGHVRGGGGDEVAFGGAFGVPMMMPAIGVDIDIGAEAMIEVIEEDIDLPADEEAPKLEVKPIDDVPEIRGAIFKRLFRRIEPKFILPAEGIVPAEAKLLPLRDEAVPAVEGDDHAHDHAAPADAIPLGEKRPKLLKALEKIGIRAEAKAIENTIKIGDKEEDVVEKTRRLFTPPEEGKAADAPEIEAAPARIAEFIPVAPAVDVELPAVAELAPREGFFGKIMRGMRKVLPLGGLSLEEPEMVPADFDGAVEAVEFAMPADMMFEEFGEEGDIDGGDGPRMVQIGKDWKGGIEGFKLLKDVQHLSALELRELDLTDGHVEQVGQLAELRQLNLQSCRFDRAAIDKLKAAKPDLTVLAFGEAVFGISGESHGEGFHVSFVAPESGAARAGIAINDVITRLGGEPLNSFEQLTHQIASRKIGDKLEVTLLRQSKPRTVEVTLRAREGVPAP